MTTRILSKQAIKEEKGVPYSNPHLLRMEKEGRFPRRINVSDNRVAWLESEIDQWIADRAAKRDDPPVTRRPRGRPRRSTPPVLDGPGNPPIPLAATGRRE